MNIGFLDVGGGITATGTTQATAQLVVNGIGLVTTAASGSGVLLQTALQSAPQIIYNASANVLKVYPPVGMQINGLAVNIPHVLPPTSMALFWTVSSTQLIAMST